MKGKTLKLPLMPNTLDYIPVDKTWSPMESGRKMKREVQSGPPELLDRKCKQYFEKGWKVVRCLAKNRHDTVLT